jgi:hypothetical protein
MNTVKHNTHNHFEKDNLHLSNLIHDPRFWLITGLIAFMAILVTLAAIGTGEGMPSTGGYPFGYPYTPIP